MGNEEAFRKVKEKLAGFETGFRDDSWQLFEQHRLKKERDRKLAGALRTGVLALVILGILMGSWLLLNPGKQVARSGTPGTALSKRMTGAGTVATGKAAAHDRSPGGVAIPANPNSAAVVKDSKPEKANSRVSDSISGSSGLTLPYKDSARVSTHSAPALPVISKGLLNKGFSYYRVNLEWPVIQGNEMPMAGDTGRVGRRFQLSLGPAVRANYAKPSENRFTLGPAIFGTFPISSIFSLRGGLALMREHVYVSNTNPVFTENAVRWLNRGDYRWWELEIPLDVQVRFHHNARYSLSGLLGVSSSLVWGEHFRELYQKGKIVTTTLALYDGQIREVQGLASRQEEPLTGRSDGAVFVPASYLNASILLEKRLTSSSLILIEPQVRYPIGGVTSRNLKFTSIGLQIRISY
jgi:hypothetical protein